MPRKTYDKKSGRRRPFGTDGDAFRALVDDMARRRPTPPLPTDAADSFRHNAGCRGSSLTAFQGSRGDLMARCHTCGALHPVTTNTEETR